MGSGICPYLHILISILWGVYPDDIQSPRLDFSGSSRLISSHLVSSRLISSHLISSHLLPSTIPHPFHVVHLLIFSYLFNSPLFFIPRVQRTNPTPTIQSYQSIYQSINPIFSPLLPLAPSPLPSASLLYRRLR
jgi:hypothetical protein